MHAQQIISPDQVHIYAPGKIISERDTGQDDRRRLFFRDYGFQPSIVSAPGIQGVQIVIYREGSTLIRRRCGEGWKEEHVTPGSISLMGSERASDWEWCNPIDVSHVYLANGVMADTAASAFEQDYRKLETMDVLRLEDEKLSILVGALVQELRSPGDGGNLFADAVASALSVHLIRHYHRNCIIPGVASSAQRLTPVQRARVLDFIRTNISHNFKLLDLAKVSGLSEFQFLRCFKSTFGASPHQYVLEQRVRLAVEQICTTDRALAEIAFALGFSDQAHMTRVIRKSTGVTPGALRKP
jgi:AraC family transcriptional regulator